MANPAIFIVSTMKKRLSMLLIFCILAGIAQTNARDTMGDLFEMDLDPRSREDCVKILGESYQ